jgi:glucose-1-phosphate thymidylyltransferase
MVSCPEEVAYRMGYISRDQLGALGKAMKNNSYGQYLMKLAGDPSERVG